MTKQEKVKKEKKKKDRTHLIVKEEPLGGMTLLNIWRLLWIGRFRVHPKYWLRFIYAYCLCLITWPLRAIEWIAVTRKVKKTKVKTDPLFVIGHYRTGTTYLMTLLAYDKSKGYCSNLEGYVPHFFITFHGLAKKLIDASLPETRPMDDVVMGSDEPTEEEYAIGAMSKYGFYNGFIFPKKFKHFSKYNAIEDHYKEKDVKKWRKVYETFVRKLTLKYKGRMLILKNPTITYKIKLILKMYPNAKFVHLYRNPYTMYASTVRFFREVFAIYAVQTWKDEDLQQGIIDNYKEMYELFNETRKLIPKERIIDIKYEDFIKDPMSDLKRIYKDLDIEGFEECKENFAKYIKSQESYTPGKHIISDDVINRVNDNWDFIREMHGYERLEPKGSE
ncbi:MAG: sulfotransferase [Asgard group archaeon]|nr:sulfotransferase [Asgard group archaeon]